MTDSAVQKTRGRPSRNGKGQAQTRQALIWRALELWTEKGFAATGLNEVLSSVNVPKGSFYHYFASKEAFAAAVIQAYADYLSHKLANHFGRVDISPLDRLSGFIEEAELGLRKYGYRRGCLVGNLGQELAGLDADLRQQLGAVFDRWETQLAGLLLDAKNAGELHKSTDPASLSRFFWMGWEGAILRARLNRDAEPLWQFREQFLRLCRCDARQHPLPQEGT